MFVDYLSVIPKVLAAIIMQPPTVFRKSFKSVQTSQSDHYKLRDASEVCGVIRRSFVDDCSLKFNVTGRGHVELVT